MRDNQAGGRVRSRRSYSSSRASFGPEMTMTKQISRFGERDVLRRAFDGKQGT